MSDSKLPAVSTIIRRCRGLGLLAAALLLGCDGPSLRPSPQERFAVPTPVVYGAEPLPIVPCLYQADPPEPSPEPIVEAEPEIVVVLPERTVAGFSQTLKVQTRGIPAALPLRWKLPPASVQVGDATVNFADECHVSEKGRVLHFSWPVPGPLVFRVTAGIAVREAGEVIGFDVLEQEITFTQTAIGPVPTPEPPTPPGPGPTPPGPVGFRVLIVEETADRDDLPIPQLNALCSTKLREYLNSHCVKVNGQPEWRVFDQHVSMAHESADWQEAMRRPRASVPWLLVTNGREGFEGPLPADEAAILDLLKKYGGP